MRKQNTFYLMENVEETFRLEIKTDVDATRKQAEWCGIKPGMRVLDVGCGSGKTTALLHELVQPGGTVVGIDISEDRIEYARCTYGNHQGIEFVVGDFAKPLNNLGYFDFIWVRFILEYFFSESVDIVRNLSGLMNPGGYLCLLDLDHNCLNHYEISKELENFIVNLMKHLQNDYNFDAYAGRKLYSYIYDAGLINIEVNVQPHHLIYGSIKDNDLYNWKKKLEVIAPKLESLFLSYPGGYEMFSLDFEQFIVNPRRFTYTPLIMCKSMKPFVEPVGKLQCLSV